MSRFDELEVQRLLQYLTERGDLGKEIMLLLDDIAFRAQFGSKAAEVASGVVCHVETSEYQYCVHAAVAQPDFLRPNE